MRCSRRFGFRARRSGLQGFGGDDRSESAFIERELRFNIVTAAYGRVMGDRVFITTDDPQVAKAVDVVPKARDLAMSSAAAKPASKVNRSYRSYRTYFWRSCFRRKTKSCV